MKSQTFNKTALLTAPLRLLNISVELYGLFCFFRYSTAIFSASTAEVFTTVGLPILFVVETQMSSPRKPKPVRLNLVPGAPPKAGEEPLDSPSSVLAPQLDAISIPKSYTALDLKVFIILERLRSKK